MPEVHVYNMAMQRGRQLSTYRRRTVCCIRNVCKRTLLTHTHLAVATVAPLCVWFSIRLWCCACARCVRRRGERVQKNRYIMHPLRAHHRYNIETTTNHCTGTKYHHLDVTYIGLGIREPHQCCFHGSEERDDQHKGHTSWFTIDPVVDPVLPSLCMHALK